MKSSVKAMLLVLLVNAPVYATEMPRLQGTNNPITLYNHTTSNVGYTMKTFLIADRDYGIQAGKKSVYHSHYADEYLTVMVGVCALISWNGVCREMDYRTYKNCVNNVHYDGNLIKEIHIDSLRSCTVTCVDGSNDSCIVD